MSPPDYTITVRLDEATDRAIEALVVHLSKYLGEEVTRSQVVRYAIRETYKVELDKDAFK